MDAVDAVVIGAGVVGLAIGRALAQRGLETILLEAAGAIGTATSSRNSEVIHAGIYYATGSLKARLCVAGRERLVDHCVAHGVAHRRCGELIVATDAAQRPQLERLREQATCNGVHDLCWLEADELRAIEPQLRAVAARHFSLIGRAPFSHLVYPVPEAAGLGVHLTLDLGGQARFGPDVEWIELSSPDEVFYGVDPFRAAGFEAAIRRYWRGLPDLALQPAYSGVRSKLALAGTVLQDFMLHGPAEHGVAGLMNLFGIESPGLTASLALADEVVSRLGL